MAETAPTKRVSREIMGSLITTATTAESITRADPCGDRRGVLPSSA